MNGLRLLLTTLYFMTIFIWELSLIVIPINLIFRWVQETANGYDDSSLYNPLIIVAIFVNIAILIFGYIKGYLSVNNVIASAVIISIYIICSFFRIRKIKRIKREESEIEQLNDELTNKVKETLYDNNGALIPKIKELGIETLKDFLLYLNAHFIDDDGFTTMPSVCANNLEKDISNSFNFDSEFKDVILKNPDLSVDEKTFLEKRHIEIAIPMLIFKHYETTKFLPDKIIDDIQYLVEATKSPYCVPADLLTKYKDIAFNVTVKDE